MTKNICGGKERSAIVEKSESLTELSKALSAAQSEIRGASKESNNPFFNSTYADLASVWEAIRQPMTKNGLAVSQLLNSDDNGQLWIDTMLLHSSGQYLRSRVKVTLGDRATPQAVGSACTYFRRYALSAIMCVPAVDDDGEAAMGREPAKPPKKAQPQAAVKTCEPQMPVVETRRHGPAATIAYKIKKEPDTVLIRAMKLLESAASVTELDAAVAKICKVDWNAVDQVTLDELYTTRKHEMERGGK